MTSNLLSHLSSADNANLGVTLNGDMPAVSSMEIARHFQKKHLHILRDIDVMRTQVPEIFFETNFGFKEKKTVVGYGIRKDRVYSLSRDAFSLLVMGFTGAAALKWKIKYIEAFNAFEKALTDIATVPQAPHQRQPRTSGACGILPPPCPALAHIIAWRV